MSKKHKKDKKHKKNKPTLAEKADKYKLYGQSVQEPDHEIEFFDQAYKEAIGGKPKVLREDFCGTFAVCCEWVKAGRDRKAYGVDLDPEPLDWGKAHNLTKLTKHQQERVKLIQDDVRSKARPKADVLAAQNFSFFIFKTRDELREYFQHAYNNIATHGIMVADMLGGPECWAEEHKDVRKIKGFKYVWEQKRINPITHESLFYIHFKFKDGSKLSPAFSYHWRFWTLPEVSELLREVGFKELYFYWEEEDEDGEETGIWHRVTEPAADPCWLAYVVAVK